MTIRLISDENISWRLKRYLPGWDILPSNEIRPASRLSDKAIWQFAKDSQYHILTFDEDFFELQTLYAYPPKIIWLRLGNTSTKEIAFRLLQLETNIISFLTNDDQGVLEVFI